MKLEEVKEKMIPVLKSYDIAKASVFGSVARDEARPDSDVDLLVELGTPMGMIKYTRMINELEDSVGTSVDVITNKSINKFLKPYILQDLQVIYEK
jgi:predicted nucleotidyltransferase